MSGEVELLLLLTGVHVVGLVCVAVMMIPALRDNPDSPPWWRDQGPDDDWRRGPGETPKPPGPPRGGIPLPDAEQARVRLRDHGRLADYRPRRERRPTPEPQRRPVRTSRRHHS
jgi:hypothetical protein